MHAHALTCVISTLSICVCLCVYPSPINVERTNSCTDKQIERNKKWVDTCIIVIKKHALRHTHIHECLKTDKEIGRYNGKQSKHEHT